MGYCSKQRRVHDSPTHWARVERVEHSIDPQPLVFLGVQRWPTPSPSLPWPSSCSSTSSGKDSIKPPGEVKTAFYLGCGFCWKARHVGNPSVALAGWSWECLQDWASFLHLAIPSMLMLCIEWWAYEVGSFLSGACAGGDGGRAGGLPGGNRLAGARCQLSVFTRYSWHGGAGSPVHHL